MPMIIDGYVAVPAKTLTEHRGHPLVVPAEPDGLGVRIWCETCATEIAREHRSTLLPCGCGTRSEHDEGIALQTRLRKDFRIPRSTCVGCYLGDDGPSIHSCYIHQI